MKENSSFQGVYDDYEETYWVLDNPTQGVDTDSETIFIETRA